MDLPHVLAAGPFEAYGVSHGAVVLLLGLGAWWLVAYGRAHRGTYRADRFSRAFAVFVAALLPLQLLQLHPDRFAFDRSLPVQLCDLAWMVSVYALWSRRRWAVALTYYWGLTLTTQSVLTPDLSRDFPDLGFITYWTMHLLVLWTAIYLTWGLGIRPTWHGYRTTVALTLGWVVAMFVLNYATGTNYGYFNAKPGSASALDLLGPWPVYVVAEIAIVATFWALITWPWERAASHRQLAQSHLTPP
jgi:hypothetical integral membrane protein (TIGR02206 family)